MIIRHLKDKDEWWSMFEHQLPSMVHNQCALHKSVSAEHVEDILGDIAKRRDGHLGATAVRSMITKIERYSNTGRFKGVGELRLLIDTASMVENDKEEIVL